MVRGVTDEQRGRRPAEAEKPLPAGTTISATWNRSAAVGSGIKPVLPAAPSAAPGNIAAALDPQSISEQALKSAYNLKNLSPLRRRICPRHRDRPNSCHRTHPDVLSVSFMAVLNASVHAQSGSRMEAHPRLLMEVSPELVELLDKLATRSQTTRTEVLRKAIALLDVSTQATDRGQKIGILDEKDKLIQEIVGI